MSYRFDNRTKEEFQQDIERSTKIERELMTIYVKWLNESGKAKYTFKDLGIDNSGKFIEDDKAVTCESDFILYKNGTRPRRIEIKHCVPQRSCFHLKENHLRYCVEKDVCIVNFMGIGTATPSFCVLTPAQLEKELKDGEKKKFWSKPCRRLYNSKYKWIYYADQ
jgi:hypothetical protein